MPIDWFTVIAQGINFLLLLWLLKRFLYHPIIDGLDAREKKIAGILADADTCKSQAENLRTEYESKLAHIEQERTQLVGEAKNEAQMASQSLLDNARHNAEQIVKKRVAALRLEMAELKQDVLQQNIHEVYAISRKVLTELADGDLHTKMIDKLVQRLNTLDDDQHAALTRALANSGNQIVVRSAQPLAEAQKKQLLACLQQYLPSFKKDSSQNNSVNAAPSNPAPSIKLSESIVPRLINGIELTMGGWKLAWSTDNYLAELQEDVEAEFIPFTETLLGLPENEGTDNPEANPPHAEAKIPHA
ncbi:ATP synthase F0 subcomplex B subunit [Paraglaciecola sp. T6c]|uniref:ATP synthase subunit b 1 n=1 Tax=Pseudoalteromonas atlantica (strain T6c / ATCC BAA-1087) TaxID=3042615 RepID=ATPF1_PSEA6|nr:F0F1 ATP synthase subunit B [Paraglaciecola sp. T6c]Q15SF2.1 RecName: Full=ATP synthase subunit b 1; AltName: Full=ATP synthase F(0) sector subunit b 1; AltName: Full=ATPase subunit I 1; AltName: Full=F-type ATPase subunit b 1; Short=F-ATPase subunit b 1 [Paraglaciecola sp. T6c]ABG41186.1 ATP synthase F0 subcomplex B subunit [Paraglaciecola sp. T6c]